MGRRSGGKQARNFRALLRDVRTAGARVPPEMFDLADTQQADHTVLNVVCQRCGKRVARARFGSAAVAHGEPDWSQVYAEGIDLTVGGTIAARTCSKCGREDLQMSVDRVRERLLSQWRETRESGSVVESTMSV